MIRLPGLARLQHDLRAMGQALRDLEPVNRAAARLAASRAKPPRRSGALGRSLDGEATQEGWGITSNLRYGGFVEGGTRHMEAHPFATPAIEDNEPAWLQLYRNHADKAVEHVAGNHY